jgi:hypothetical protein
MTITYSLFPAHSDGEDQPEGTATPTVYQFLVFRSTIDADSFPDETLSWDVSGSGANPADGGDFSLSAIFPSGTVHFSAGSFVADDYITFDTLPDSDVEPDEGFTLTLSNGIVLASIAGIIRNDDVQIIGGTGGADTLVGSDSIDLLVGIGNDIMEASAATTLMPSATAASRARL